MAYIYNFCFYFSLRLGSIIIGIISLLQGVAKIIIFSISSNDPAKVVSDIKYIKRYYDTIYLNSFLETLQNGPEKYITIFLIASVIYTASCIMIIYGAYTCTELMLYPYILLECVRFMLLFSSHVTLMMIIKENVVNLGLLIGLTILGGFILLGVFYCWFCVFNMASILKKLKKEIEILENVTYPKTVGDGKEYNFYSKHF